MLEILYDVNTLEVRAWNADPLAQGNLLPGPGEDIVIFPIDLPAFPSDCYKVDLVDQTLITTPSRPDYDLLMSDAIRAEELLATSPAVITQPQIWELLRIFGRRLGFSFKEE